MNTIRMMASTTDTAKSRSQKTAGMIPGLRLGGSFTSSSMFTLETIILASIEWTREAFVGFPGRVDFARHSQNRVDHQGADADRDHVFPADVHELIVAEAGEGAAEPDHDVDDHPDL